MTKQEKKAQCKVQIKELLQQIEKKANEKIEVALNSGAIEEGSEFMLDNFLLSKCVLNIVQENCFKPYSQEIISLYKNLSRFI